MATNGSEKKARKSSANGASCPGCGNKLVGTKHYNDPKAHKPNCRALSKGTKPKLKVTAHKVLKKGTSSITVEFVWFGAKLDRPCTNSIELPRHDIADRLIAAVNAQKAFRNPEVVKDIRGKTYVEADQLFMGRYLNSFLNNLGF